MNLQESSSTNASVGELRHVEGRRSRDRILWFWLAAALVFAVFLTPRLMTMNAAVIVEDHDSMSYLGFIALLSGDRPAGKDRLNPDFTPMFPAAATIIGAMGFERETAARLASLLFATVGLLSLSALLWQFVGRRAALVAGLLIAMHPALIRLDVAVLSEPTYIGLVLLGIYLYGHRWGAEPRRWHGLLIGLVFGATFLARTEGFAYLLLIPMVHLTVVICHPAWRGLWRRHLEWTGLYVLGFLLLAGPQIAWVSKESGRLAINGRQTWMQLTAAMPDIPYNERIYGLHFDPAQVNIDYLYSRGEVLSGYRKGNTSAPSVFDLRKVAGNVKLLVTKRVRDAIRLPGMLFAAIGVIAMFVVHRSRPLLVLFSIPAIMMGPVLLHTVAPRHVMLLTPILLASIAIALVAIVRGIERLTPNRTARWAANACVILGALGAYTYRAAAPIRDTILAPPTHNHEYAPLELRPVVELIRARNPDSDLPVVMARKSYVPYLAEARKVNMPWADYEATVRYAQLNAVDFVFSQDSVNADFPFMPELDKHPDTFELIYRDEGGGSPFALYRFHPRSEAAP